MLARLETLRIVNFRNVTGFFFDVVCKDWMHAYCCSSCKTAVNRKSDLLAETLLVFDCFEEAVVKPVDL